MDKKIQEIMLVMMLPIALSVYATPVVHGPHPRVLLADSNRTKAAPSVSGATSIQSVSGPLTLEQCITIALSNNPEVIAQGWEAQRAQAQRDEAAGEKWPNIKSVGGYTHDIDDQRLVPIHRPNEPGVFTDDVFAGDIVLTMPIYTAGRITNRIKAADLLRRAAEHHLARTREELVFNVSSVFYAILGQRRVIESLEFSQKALDEHRKRVEHLIAVKKAAHVDLLRTQVRLADIEQRLLREKNVLAIQRRVLANQMGVTAGPGMSPVTVLGELKLLNVESNSTADLQKAFANRSDYLAAKTELEAQKRRVDVARAGRKPIVSLQGSYGGRWSAGDSITQSGADESEDVGRAAVVVTLPIFEGGSIGARIRVEQARLAAAQERLRKLELRIRLDVETAALDVNSNRERVAATEKAVEQAKESLRIEREKYELRRGSITDVLDAQAALLQAQTSYYRALADYNTSIAELHLAMGEEK